MKLYTVTVSLELTVEAETETALETVLIAWLDGVKDETERQDGTLAEESVTTVAWPNAPRIQTVEDWPA